MGAGGWPARCETLRATCVGRAVVVIGTTIELNERCDFYRWGSADRAMHTLTAHETFLTDTVGDNTFF